MPTPEIYAVILAGGSGTRFWPASRRTRPKQYLPIVAGRALLAETCARLRGLVDWEHILVVTARSQVGEVRTCLPELAEANLLAEAVGRNTAASVSWAAFEVARRNPQAVQVVLPSDQIIAPAESLRRTLRAGAQEAAESDALVTFGIRPTWPATAYGYIEAGEQLGSRAGIEVRRVLRFVEKPEATRAREFLATQRFSWNSGIFAWSTGAILAAVERHAPEIHRGLEQALRAGELESCYAGLPALPIDVAVLEKADNVRMLPIDYAWSDVGSWSALPEVSAADAQGNWPFLSNGARLLAEDSSGCVAYAEGEQVIALLGVRDLVVVQAGNATLVCARECAQQVRKIVERLEKEGGAGFL